MSTRTRSGSATPSAGGGRRTSSIAPAGAGFAFHATPRGDTPDSPLWTIVAYSIVLALAAGLLAMVLGPHKVGDYFTETDFYGAYADGARLIQGGRIDPSRYGVIGPVYEILLALAGLVVRDLLFAAELLSIAATVAIALLWFHLLRGRLNARAAVLVVAFLATNAWLFRFGYSAATDAPAIAIQALALSLLFTSESPSSRRLLVAGVVAAIAFLTRYNAVYLLPAGLLGIVAGGAHAQPRGRAAMSFALGFLLPVVPWVAYSLSHGGSVSFQLHHNIAYEVFARARGIPWDDYQAKLQSEFPNLAAVIARDPMAVVSRMLFNMGDHFRLDAAKLLGWPLAIAAVCGIGFGLRDGSLRRTWPLLAAAGLCFLTLVPVFHAERYSLALLPAYATMAAIAFTSPLAAMVTAGGRLWLKPLLVAIPLFFAGRASYALQARTIDQLPVEVLEAGATLRELKRPGDRVIARKGHIGFHGGVEAIGFPFADDLAALAAYAHRSRARWLYFSWPEAETRPRFFHLLDTSAVVPGLTVRRVTRPHPAVLYEIGPQFGAAPSWFARETLRTWHDMRGRLLVDGSQKDLLYRYGGLSWTMGRFTDARAALEHAQRIDPQRREIPQVLGRVQLESGDLVAAEATFARAEEIDPRNPEGRIGRGLAVYMQGRLVEAADLWRPVIVEVTSPNILGEMVSLYRSRGEEAEARAAEQRLAFLRGAQP